MQTLFKLFHQNKTKVLKMLTCINMKLNTFISIIVLTLETKKFYLFYFIGGLILVFPNEKILSAQLLLQKITDMKVTNNTLNSSTKVINER